MPTLYKILQKCPKQIYMKASWSRPPIIYRYSLTQDVEDWGTLHAGYLGEHHQSGCSPGCCTKHEVKLEDDGVSEKVHPLTALVGRKLSARFHAQLCATPGHSSSHLKYHLLQGRALVTHMYQISSRAVTGMELLKGVKSRSFIYRVMFRQSLQDKGTSKSHFLCRCVPANLAKR